MVLCKTVLHFISQYSVVGGGGDIRCKAKSHPSENFPAHFCNCSSVSNCGNLVTQRLNAFKPVPTFRPSLTYTFSQVTWHIYCRKCFCQRYKSPTPRASFKMDRRYHCLDRLLGLSCQVDRYRPRSEACRFFSGSCQWDFCPFVYRG